jgi:hypothetical protein
VTRYWIDATTVSFREVGSEVVVLDLRSSSYITVNDAGALLWRRLSQGASADELGHTLAEGFDLPPDDARRDSAAFLDELVARHFVTTDDPSL